METLVLLQNAPKCDAEEMRPRVHKYLYREAKYFMVKSNNHENVRLAKAKGVWSTPPQNEQRFNQAVKVLCDNSVQWVILHHQWWVMLMFVLETVV